MEPIKDLNNQIGRKDIGMIYGKENIKFKAIDGCFDTNTPLSKILIANTSKEKIIIEKGEIVGETNVERNTKISKNEFETDLDNTEDIIECYKGPEKYKTKFKEMIENTAHKAKTNKCAITTRHEITLTEECPKINCNPYRISPKEKEILNKNITEMIKNKIIKESNSPIASPVVLIKKKNGERRICIDYRMLNRLTVKDQFPIPKLMIQ